MPINSRQIIIADNQFLVIDSLQRVLLEDFGMHAGTVVGTKHELKKALTDRPDALLIIDYNHIDFDDISEMRKFLELYKNLIVMILTDSVSVIELTELNTAGIKNIIFKTADRDELSQAVRSILSGKKHYCQEVLDMFTEINQEKGTIREDTILTHTEIDIIRSIAEGFTTKQIALKRHNSYHTVMTHRKNIFRKLNVRNASELVMFAIRNGIIDTVDYHI